MLDMRLGNNKDIPFIMNLVREGITSGAFFYANGDGLETVKSELQAVTQKYSANIPVADYLFIFDEQLTRKPVGFALLTGRNNFAGLASHLEIRMFAVSADKQGKGIGKSMLNSIMAKFAQRAKNVKLALNSKITHLNSRSQSALASNILVQHIEQPMHRYLFLRLMD